MDSFYIVLPSNTPFPGNKTSDYLVKLPNIIDLSDGNWSVALSSITYPLSFSGVDEEQYIHIYYENDKNTKINFPKRLQYSNVKQFENVINDAILSSLFDETKVTVKPRMARATDSKPRPPLKETSSDQKPLPPLKSATEPKPRPPLKLPPSETPKSGEQLKDVQPAVPNGASTLSNERPTPSPKTTDKEPKPSEKPRPPLKHPPTETPKAGDQLKDVQPAEPSDGSTLSNERPTPPSKSADTEPKPAEKPRPPLKQPPTETTKTGKDLEQPSTIPSDESYVSNEKPTPPSKTPETTTETKPTEKPRPPEKTSSVEETTTSEKDKPSQRDEISSKPEGQIQLTEKELQSLETAKRVSNQLIEDLDEKFEEIEQLVNDAFGFYDLVHETHIPDDALKAKNIKSQIIEQTNPLISLKFGFIGEFNKAKEAQIKTSIEYSRQNVKEAKISTDQIKNIKQNLIIGKEEEPSLFNRIKKRYDKVVELYEEFAKTMGLPSANLNTVYYEAKGYFDKTKKAYDEFTNIVDELFNYMNELEKFKEKDPELVLTLNPVVSMRTFGNGKYEELELIKYQLENYYNIRNLEEAQKALIKMKAIKNTFINDDDNTGYLPESKRIKEKFLAGFNKFKSVQALKDAEIANKTQISSEEKSDSWDVSNVVKEHNRLFGEESHLEGHIPKIEPMKEKVEKVTTDSWNLISGDSKELLDYRKEAIINKIKTLLDTGVELGGFKGIKRSAYQQIYFYYDADQLQRFYFWASPGTLFNIKKVKISKQLAYMLGFVTDDNNYVQFNSFGKYSPDISGGLHSFYVYSPNLIANTIIGNQYGPLLRVVNVDLETKNKVVETIYTQEFHHKVILKQIPEINIKILSDSGRPIEFNWGNCIITLHFKRAIF